MSDIPHDSDDGFHEIQLSGKQLVFLFMATTVVSVVIFLCGVLVGRGVRVDAQAETPEAIAASTPARTPEQPRPENPTTAEPPTPPADGAGAAQLSYPNVLDEKKSRPEERRTAAAAPPPAGRTEPAPGTPPPAPKVETRSEAKAEPKPEPKKKTEPAAAAAPPQASRSGKWVVQLVALRDRSAANSIVQRLASKGYPAFVVSPAAGSPVPVYKVQVGRYDDRAEAERIARRLEKEEKFNPWISR